MGLIIPETFLGVYCDFLTFLHYPTVLLIDRLRQCCRQLDVVVVILKYNYK